MIKRVLVVVCLLCVVGVVPAMAVATTDSATWTTKVYDGSYLPITTHPELWDAWSVVGGGLTPAGVEAAAMVLYDHEDTGIPGAIAGEKANYISQGWLNANGGQMLYKSTTVASFDFDAGATMEQRIGYGYGVTNQTDRMGMGDATQNQAVSLLHQSGTNLWTLDVGLAELNPSVVLPLGWGDGFQVFRVTVLGEDVKVYRNDDTTPILSSTTIGAGSVVNNLVWGVAQSTAFHDYYRWTNEGAFDPIPEPATMVLLAVGGLLLRKKR